MKTFMKLSAAAIALTTASITYAAPPSVAGQASPTHALTRAEVQADLAIWQRAGMSAFWRGQETPDVYSAGYRKAEAEYVRMRNGAEYQQELQRLQK
ncbi:Uncharacterised protein [Bordetella ansorpii]|uniref:Lipoprotein n=1 Tax=Bordetella ansorpii TaxID=288768 RepID=A0A157Q784_9BORD|nr:DUF4148 domain-containing protein [Bordetella ansorpii]SAI41743.1 Uncharacterised protein [Bordetella ansorpii]